MYQDDGSDVKTESSEGSNVGNGRIHFQLEYDFQANDLIISVLECKDLAAKDFGGTSDPYVKVCVLPDKRLKHQTRVHKKTLNPQFNETFVFHQMEFRSITDRSVYFEVIDFDHFSKHDMIGVLDIPLESVDLTKTTDMWQELRSPGKNVSSDLGEILFALCYLPTAGRLTTVIMKAKNLKAMDFTGKSGVYKCRLVGQVITKLTCKCSYPCIIDLLLLPQGY
jgi:synaptotagmin-1